MSDLEQTLAEMRRRATPPGQPELPVHLIVGPREYIGLQAQGRLVCGEADVPMYQRTRDPANVTCPCCGVEAIAVAADQAAHAAYQARLERYR